MGQKVHPHGFRLGYIYDWNSKWYADRNYTEQLHGDLAIRGAIKKMLPDAGIARVEIERNANQITVSVHTARPGIVIGRGGQRVDELRTSLEKLSGNKVRVNINEIRVPEIEAPLVARAVAEQIERRVAHRRAIKQAALRAMQRGAKGVRIRISGRLGGSDMSRTDQERQGRVPLHTLRADVDYGTSEARTTLGQIGVKVWIYKGDKQIERVQRRKEPEAATEEEGQAAAEPPATEAPAEIAAPEPVAKAAELEALAETAAQEPIAEVAAPEAVAETPISEDVVPAPVVAEKPASKRASKAAPRVARKTSSKAAAEKPAPKAAAEKPAPKAAAEEPAPEAETPATEEKTDASA
ncbi:MAG: 30S ribosomal protein S3 [Chloroflexota bacterium]|nr:30S ribosomal protein S3 [Chloroflexota bacterium]